MSPVRFMYLAEITVFDPESSVETVMRFSTGLGFTSAGTDSPAHTHYAPRLEQAVEMTRSVFAPGTTSGRSSLGFGDLVLLNPDGALDSLVRQAVDGRSVVIFRGPATAVSLTEFSPVFVGTMEQAEFDVRRVFIKLRDRQATLNAPLQQHVYGGTNALPDGLDGVAGDIAGSRKPLLYGRVLNMTPTPVNTARLIYQVHDGEVAAVQPVYDYGIPLAAEGFYGNALDLLNDSLAPSPGGYKVYLDGGYVRLGASPVGVVTADVIQGAFPSDRTASAIASAVLLRAGVDVGDINTDDLSTLATQNGAELGLRVGDAETASEIMDQLANTVGGWWGVDTAGRFRFQRLDRPLGNATATIAANDLVSSPMRQATGDENRGVPVRTVSVRYGRNHTVQTDLAAGVSDAYRARASGEWLSVIADDPSVAVRHKLATTLDIVSVFAFRADALAEATRRLRLLSVLRHRFVVTADYTSIVGSVDIGHTVGLLHPRFGLTIEGDEIGGLFIVIGVEPNAKDGVVRFSLWGNSFTTFNLVTDTGAFLVADDLAALITDTR